MKKSIDKLVGNTDLVQIRRVAGKENFQRNNEIWGKMEGDNPSGSVKDRAALGMIMGAERRGDIKPGDTLIEPTSGNTGIALAMMAAARGYKIKLVMAKQLSIERKQTMEAYGAEVILVDGSSTTDAIDLARKMVTNGEGFMLDQFSNDDNWKMHYYTTGPEIWKDTNGRVTHFVSAMGTMGTITGVSRFLKEKNPDIQIIGVQPDDASERIHGITRWPPGYEPAIGRNALIDRVIDVGWEDARSMAIRMAKFDGIFCGFSAAAACVGALRTAENLENAVIVFIVCDRGDRYLSMDIFGNNTKFVEKS